MIAVAPESFGLEVFGFVCSTSIYPEVLSPCTTKRWKFEVLFWPAEPAKVPAEASVLIVGTGLSMADVVVSLASHNHTGRVTAISRRGIIPKSHDPGKEAHIYAAQFSNA